MSDAKNNPVNSPKGEVHSSTLHVPNKRSIDLSLDKDLVHGESIPLDSAPSSALNDFYEQLTFNEEPITIIIQSNSNDSKVKETHVPVQVNGKGAEVFVNGKWTEFTWLPIGPMLTIKRKYLEVLARAKSNIVQTRHEEATVERPHNRMELTTKQNFPFSITHDANPKGVAWLQNIMMER